MKKYVVLVIVISFLLIIMGLFLNFNNLNSNKTTVKTRQINTSEALKKEHCLGLLCIQKMQITYRNKLGMITFILINKGNEIIPADFIKLEFDHNKNLSYISYHAEILPNQTQQTEIEVSNDDILQMKDYEIKKLTASELAKIET